MAQSQLYNYATDDDDDDEDNDKTRFPVNSCGFRQHT
jgi:hypothetical protein